MEWADHMIDYYRSEAIRGWTFYQAAMLERYQTNLENSYTADCLNVTTKTGSNNSKLIMALGANLHQAITRSQAQFEENIRRLRNGEIVDDLPAIDPSLSIHQLQIFIEERLKACSTQACDDRKSSQVDITKDSPKSLTCRTNGEVIVSSNFHLSGDETSGDAAPKKVTVPTSKSGENSVELMFSSDSSQSADSTAETVPENAYAEVTTQTSPNLIHVATQSTVEVHDVATQCCRNADKGQQASDDLSVNDSDSSHLRNASDLLNERTKRRFCSEQSTFSSNSTASELSDTHSQSASISNYPLNNHPLIQSNQGVYQYSYQTAQRPLYNQYITYPSMYPSQPQVCNPYLQQSYMYYSSGDLSPSFPSQQASNIIYPNALPTPLSSSVHPGYTQPPSQAMNRCFGRPTPRWEHYKTELSSEAESLSSTGNGVSATTELSTSPPVVQEPGAVQDVRPKTTVSAPHAKTGPAVKFTDHKTFDVPTQDLVFQWTESERENFHEEARGDATLPIRVSDITFGQWNETDEEVKSAHILTSSLSSTTSSLVQDSSSPQDTSPPSQTTSPAVADPAAAVSAVTQSSGNEGVQPTDEELKSAKKAARKLRKRQKKAAKTKTSPTCFLVDQSECTICFKDLLPSDRYQLECGHNKFHRECVSEWLTEWSSSSDCPVCRYVVKGSK